MPGETEGLVDLPLPDFHEHFESFIDESKKNSILKKVVPVSLTWNSCKKLCENVKVGKNNITTLSFAEIHRHAKRRYGPEIILYPSFEDTLGTWNDIKVLRPEYTERSDKLCATVWAAYTGDLKALRKVLTQGVYLDRQTENGNTVLMEALAGRSENRCKCIELLLNAGARTNLQNKCGHTLLTAAVFLNDMSVLRLLHQMKNLKDNIDHKTKAGNTALAIAVSNKNFDMVHFLVSKCDADLLIEDNHHMTAACWAQVCWPPIAGYLCLQMGLNKQLETFVLRRNEILRELSLRSKLNKCQAGDRELFSVLYGLTMVLLMLEPARTVAVQKGMLNSLSSHPLWDWVLEEEDDILDAQILQLLPWFVALGCAMLYDENCALESFIKGGAAKRLINGLNEILLECEDDDESRVMVQALVTPLVASEFSRKWLYKVSFECTSILKHFLDEDNYIEENPVAVRKAFIMLMVANYAPYKMKDNYKYFDSAALKSLCPEPSMTVGEKLREAMAYFEEVKQQAKSRSTAEYMESNMRLEDEAKRKKEDQLLKARMRKMKARERNKVLKQQERDAAAKEGKHKKKKEPKKKTMEDGIATEINNNLIPAKKAEDMYSPQKELPKKKAPKHKFQPNTWNTSVSIEGALGCKPWSEVKEKEKMMRLRTYSENVQSPHRETRPQAQRPVNSKNKKVENMPTRSSKSNNQNHIGSAQQLSSSPSNEKNEIVATKSVNINDYPELSRKGSDRTKEELPKDVSQSENPTHSKFSWGPPKVDNRKTEVAKTSPHMASPMNQIQFPPMIPSNAITVAQLEQGERRNDESPSNVDNVDISFFYQPMMDQRQQDAVAQIPLTITKAQTDPVQPQICPKTATKGPAASSSVRSCNQSAASSQVPYKSNVCESTNTWAQHISSQQNVLRPGAAGDQVGNDKVEAAMSNINWIPRSRRWRGMFEHLVSLAPERRQKVGSIHFCFQDESLYIARGSNGTVVSIGLRDDGMEVAVKRLLRTNSRCLKNELESLRIPELEHENIVKYRDYVEDENFGYLALELCECTLEDYVHELRHNKSLHKKSKKLVWQMFHGLDVLHKAKILHRDVKPRNVLIDVRGNVRLADFGISQRMEDDQFTLYQARTFGTRCWRPRETILGEQAGISPPYKTNSDVQVAGMVAYYVMTGGLHPFGHDPAEVEPAIARGIPKFRDVHDETLINLMAWMLHPEMDKRKSAAECLTHPFFWTDSKRFLFLYKVTQEPEIRDRSRKSVVRNVIDNAGIWLKLGDWRSEIDQFFLGPEMSLQNYTCQLSDLIRLMADVEDNFNTIAVHLRTLMGDPGNYFLVKFPKVFIVVYEIIRESDLRSRRSLTEFFDISSYINE